MGEFLRYVGRNPTLGWGIGLFLVLLLFSTAGRFFIDTEDAYALATKTDLPPSLNWDALRNREELGLSFREAVIETFRHSFGTDSQGKSLLACLVMGTGMTLQIGAIAGAFGLGIGTLLGFVTGYYAGTLFDSFVTAIVDIVLTMPGFLILILIASSLTRPDKMTVPQMGLIVSTVSWAFPTRAIRAQVLSMRQRPFVMMAQLSAMSGPEIILKELMPNLLPYLVMSLANAVYGGVMGSIGLQGLGIGDRRQPYLGMIIFWLNYYSAFLRGMWWWILEPVAMIILLLTCLTLISFGLDEVANPRTRRAV
ncbi:MAG: ABC transporter permease [Anaerolineae bacterium]|nr:ABC transporter permease [Anaerolineae bacterium]